MISKNCMLHIKNFQKSYKNHLIISVEELSLKEGIYWFRGANGSGKSTFFKAVAGMIPFEGQIRFRDLDSRKHPMEYRLKVNISEAEPLYPDYLSGYDILKFISEAKHGTASQLDELAEKFGTNTYWKQSIGTYSSGMLKKISLISAFLGKPQLIMLDEPLITIDDKSVEIVYELISSLHQNQNISFLLSSHQDFRFEKLPIQNTYLVHNQTISLMD
jgi:ABC-2 type transport system ATP-binding protein